MQLKGKRIIITGGASGIGASTVKAYVREGARVASLDVADEQGASVVHGANAQASDGAGATFYRCNIADPVDVFSTFDKAVRELGVSMFWRTSQLSIGRSQQKSGRSTR